MRKIFILLFCCIAAFLRMLYPPAKSLAQQTKQHVAATTAGVTGKRSQPISDKEQQKAVLVTDSAKKTVDNVFAGIAKKDDMQQAYIATLEKNNALQEEKLKWWKNYVTKLKADNSSLLLLKEKRSVGDTLPAKMIEEDRTEFIQHLSDSIRATLPHDTVLAEKYGGPFNRKTRFIPFKNQ